MKHKHLAQWLDDVFYIKFRYVFHFGEEGEKKACENNAGERKFS